MRAGLPLLLVAIVLEMVLYVVGRLWAPSVFEIGTLVAILVVGGAACRSLFSIMIPDPSDKENYNPWDGDAYAVMGCIFIAITLIPAWFIGISNTAGFHRLIYSGQCPHGRWFVDENGSTQCCWLSPVPAQGMIVQRGTTDSKELDLPPQIIVRLSDGRVRLLPPTKPLLQYAEVGTKVQIIPGFNLDNVETDPVAPTDMRLVN
jgi:hypothetical protein